MEKGTWTIHDVETIINRRREHEPSDGISLSPAVTILAERYARMIFTGSTSVSVEELNEVERRLLSGG